MTRFDWPGLMRAGLLGLRLRPDQFWALTPAELLLMLGHGSGPAPMARDRLNELARAFPDTKERSET
ncbi:rcc01693 family protein [Actibacterium sp.]|uniref:rcc01693 family protein n=1 Tax=Actibacterium sp. TaxID=1872125 RepID=UPI00356170F8